MLTKNGGEKMTEFFEEQFKNHHEGFINQSLQESIDEINGNMEYSIRYNEEEGKPYMRYLVGFGGPNVSINFYTDDITYFFAWYPNNREVSLKGTQNYEDLWELYGHEAKEDISNLIDTLEIEY